MDTVLMVVVSGVAPLAMILILALALYRVAQTLGEARVVEHEPELGEDGYYTCKECGSRWLDGTDPVHMAGCYVPYWIRYGGGMTRWG